MIKASPLSAATAVRQDRLRAGDYWGGILAAGQTMRIVDVEGNQAADTLFYNAHDPSERYSAMDTLRKQGNVYLSAGTTLMSNKGRPLLEVVADTCGRHDTLGGACAAESNTVRYDLNKRCMHVCRDSWMLAIAENPQWNLSKRDITHNINFFMNVPVTSDGGLCFADGISGVGKYVEFTAVMDVIVLISNCPQLNNPCNAYHPTPIDLLVW